MKLFSHSRSRCSLAVAALLMIAGLPACTNKQPADGASATGASARTGGDASLDPGATAPGSVEPFGEGSRFGGNARPGSSGIGTGAAGSGFGGGGNPAAIGGGFGAGGGVR